VFYLFVLAIPFETAFMESASSIGTVPMMIGMALAGTALLQPRICFERPPAAFWCFAGYIFVCLILGMTQNLIYAGEVVARLLTLTQMLVLMWIAFNLFKYPEICEGALLILVVACAILSIFMLTGTGTVDSGQGRSTLFGDQVNTLATMLALGLIALLCITYGRIRVERTMIILAWILFPLIGTALIMTGSRGRLIGLVFGIVLLVLMKDGEWGTKLKIGLVAALAIVFLIVVSLTNDSMRTRLERSWYEGDTAGRDQIMAQAVDMFFEEPLLGWGPVRNTAELGSRVGWFRRSAHNLYLSVLIETGLLGATPFFAGLLLAVKASWEARVGREGALPMAILGSLLIMNLSGTWHVRKLFWLILAYALASAWSVRATARQVSAQSLGPMSDMVQGSGPSASFPRADLPVSQTDSVRRQRPTQSP
jgi:O-antigen ligase